MKIIRLLLFFLCVGLPFAGLTQEQRREADRGKPVAGSLPPPGPLTAEQDHRAMMDLQHIDSLRPGADGNHPEAPNAANYDESKANPYPRLPDPLVLTNGRPVSTAKSGGRSGVLK